MDRQDIEIVLADLGTLQAQVTALQVSMNDLVERMANMDRILEETFTKLLPVIEQASPALDKLLAHPMMRMLGVKK